jgi:DNA polymerase-3 subunit epsilon
MISCFVAIDFETADRGRDSACPVGLVRVEGSKVVKKEARLIRPPRCYFEFTYIHGISWSDVAGEPSFAEVWPDLQPILDGVDFLAAHNASFDRSALSACCAAADIAVPDLPFVCSMNLARRTWGVYPTRLPDVCRYLGLRLNHHNAMSDAEACAAIVVAASRDNGVTDRQANVKMSSRRARWNTHA